MRSFFTGKAVFLMAFLIAALAVLTAKAIDEGKTVRTELNKTCESAPRGHMIWDEVPRLFTRFICFG